MTKLFSERYGYKKIEVLQPDVMSDALRKRLWNAVKDFIDKRPEGNRNEVIERTWDKFFKESIDNLRVTHGIDSKYYHLDQIRVYFFNSEWYEVYDLIEFLLNKIEDYVVHGYGSDGSRSSHRDLILAISTIFEEERVPYKIVDGKITPLISETEATEIEQALNIGDRYYTVRNHLSKAVELYSKRPTPDYSNSIKESISAVEALARIILDDDKATLGNLADKLSIHQAFKEAIKKLYGWTSDESGIRHSEKSSPLQVGAEEARFMLVTCSGLVNYIIAKYGSN